MFEQVLVVEDCRHVRGHDPSHGFGSIALIRAWRCIVVEGHSARSAAALRADSRIRLADLGL